MTASQFQFSKVAPDQLRPNPFNTNVVSPDNEKKIAASLKRFGFFKPILVREVAGFLEIVGGEHRWRAAIDLGYSEVPIVNLGPISDQQAKEICLVDNGRYGADDTLKLAELLSSLGDISELTEFMPYDTADIEHIFQGASINLDDLELDDDDHATGDSAPKPTKKVQEFQIMRFKVPVADAQMVSEVMNATMKAQKFTDDDSLTNAGMALVHICREKT